ncbi:hypothetical protein GO986_00455 [Deinococcus sp. HMF7620]|uniref:Uncharacterized protein n=1 Tax=Deinococcus arboris TaxID=2682977 RepID=A0A7C9LNJ6_9DEIO|nr:hypothetical protein [Deinococcus arboris]MVN85241.1 hypothetical protein [Deinococcus arboris]
MTRGSGDNVRHLRNAGGPLLPALAAEMREVAQAALNWPAPAWALLDVRVRAGEDLNVTALLSPSLVLNKALAAGLTPPPPHQRRWAA